MLLNFIYFSAFLVPVESDQLFTSLVEYLIGTLKSGGDDAVIQTSLQCITAIKYVGCATYISH